MSDHVFGDARLPARFWSKAVVDERSGCWIWTAAKANGYGRFSIGTRAAPRLVSAHRYLFETLIGPVGCLEVDHLCRNRACVNPKHLEPVTHRDNSLRGDGTPAVNAAKTHCKHGHALEGENLKLVWAGDRTEPRRDCKACRLRWSRETDSKRRGNRARKRAA